MPTVSIFRVALKLEKDGVQPRYNEWSSSLPGRLKQRTPRLRSNFDSCVITRGPDSGSIPVWVAGAQEHISPPELQ
jgi:hypothetical protein